MTEIRKIDQVNPDQEILEEAASVIRGGGTVVFPTETVYGLGANAYSESACSKIFRAKKRPEDNPLIVHISNFSQLMDFTVEPDEKLLEPLRTLWPGPLTVLFRRNSLIPDNVAAGLGTIAVRMPANPLSLKLIDLSGVPIAAPSANIATKPSIVNSSNAIEELDGRVDMILDAGPTFFGIESTIINTLVKPPELMRPGAFNQDDLEPYFGKISITRGARGLEEVEVALTPGMKYRHYSPRSKLYILKSVDALIQNSDKIAKGRIVPIGSAQWLGELGYEGISLGSGKDLYEIARNLFPSFRALDRMHEKVGVIQPFPENGIGLAIMNRIRKAASGTIESGKDMDHLLTAST